MNTEVKTGADKVHEAVDFILHDAEGLEYENYSTSHSGQFVTLDLMAQPHIAADNCYATTDFLLNHPYLLDNITAMHERSSIVVVSEYNGSSHSAVLLSFPDQSDRVVLDFTARQFDESIPFPHIASESEWIQFMDNVIGEHSIEITGA